MVAPITDLGTITIDRTFTDGPVGVVHEKFVQRHRYRQQKPFTLVLPYHMVDRQIVKYSRPSFPPGIPDDANDDLPFALNWVSPENSSYERLRGKIYDSVNAGAAFAEYRQSVGLIANTATTLFKAYRAVRTGNIQGALSALRYQGQIPPSKRRDITSRSFARSAGSNFLAIHFGWEPLLKDIYKSCELLADPVKSFSLERGRSHDVVNAQGTIDYGSVRDDWIAAGRVWSSQSARVRFATPGPSFTLAQFGLSNPASVAWEVFPFSFLLDWVFNVGDFLSSLTDFAGMNLEYISRSRKYDVLITRTRSIKPGFGTGSNLISVRHVGLDRFTSLSGISLEVKKMKLPSVTRAATAISLLTQGLSH